MRRLAIKNKKTGKWARIDENGDPRPSKEPRLYAPGDARLMAAILGGAWEAVPVAKGFIEKK